MESAPDIFVIANPLWETTVLLAELPERQEIQAGGMDRIPQHPLAKREDTGGSAANVAVHCAQWGLEVAQVGRAGTDSPSLLARGRMHHYGVNDHIVEEPGRNLKTSAILRKQGDDEGYFCAWVPENAVTPMRWEDIPEGWVLRAKWVHLDRISEVGLRLAEARFEAGLMTSLDLHVCPGRPAAAERLDRILPCLSLVQLSEAAAQDMCRRKGMSLEPEELLASLYRPGQWLITTMGERGALAYEGDGLFYFEPAFLKGGYVDATGAGDAFVAMMIRQRMAGNSLADAMGEASRYASKTCSALGALGCFTIPII